MGCVALCCVGGGWAALRCPLSVVVGAIVFVIVLSAHIGRLGFRI